MLSPNPFTPMLLTYHPRRFYGREKELAGLLQMITSSEPGGHAIYGLRTIGKTTLLKFLKDRNGAMKQYPQFINPEFLPGGGKRLLFLYLNFHSYQPDENIFYFILMQLEEELDNLPLDEDFTVPPYDPTTPRPQIAQMIRRVVQTLENQQIRVVFLLDDFDAPLNSIDIHDDGLLRTLCDHAPMIIATEAPIATLRPDIGESSPLLGILRPEAIGLLSEPSARALINDPMTQHDLLPFGAEPEDLLLQTAGRQPFLLIAACELFFELRRDYAEADHHEISQLTNAFHHQLSTQLHITRVLQPMWNKLTPEEQQILYYVLLGESLDLTGTRGATITTLANQGLIYWDAKDYSYHLFSQLFRAFIQQNVAENTTQRAQTTATSTQTTYAVGTGALTPIDSALLRYLTNKSDQVCTFEELLDAVWEDGEKSKRALEAAVHRIRKTLPAHQTIKNIRKIGYKFVTS